MRQRQPGRWEVRVSVGTDPVSGRSIYRSVTVAGELVDARRRGEELAAQAAAMRASQQQPVRSVAELLERWLAAEHDWKPGTWRGYRSTCRRLSQDPLTRRAPATLTPPVLRAAMRTWAAAGVPSTTVQPARAHAAVSVGLGASTAAAGQPAAGRYARARAA